MSGNGTAPTAGKTALALLVALCTVPTLPWAAAAQEGGDLVAGTRVRLSVVGTAAARPATLIGTVEGLAGDSLHIRTRENVDTRAVPVSAIQRLEVSAGRKGSVKRGAQIGFLVGLAGGVAAGLASGGDQLFGAGTKAWMGGIAYGATGAGLGAIVGALVKTERWQERPGPRLEAAVSVGPSPGGPGLAVRGTLRM